MNFIDRLVAFIRTLGKEEIERLKRMLGEIPSPEIPKTDPVPEEVEFDPVVLPEDPEPELQPELQPESNPTRPASYLPDLSRTYWDTHLKGDWTFSIGDMDFEYHVFGTID